MAGPDVAPGRLPRDPSVSVDHLVDAVNWVRTGDLPGSPAIVKTNRIRALDVVLIGPLMVWGGLAARGRSRAATVAGWTLAILGLGTIWYNAWNWRRVQVYSESLNEY